MALVQAFGVRLCVLFTAAVVTAACQASPAGPGSPLAPSTAAATPIANFAGDWRIVYHVESCIGRYCYISQINRDDTLNLRLVQIGDRVSGLVGTADVEGVVMPDGSLSLRGFAPAPPLPNAASFELKQFEVRLDAERGLTGRLEYAALMSGEYSGYSSGATGPIVSATRLPLDTTSFTGAWTGYYARTSCAPAESCQFPEQDDATLVLDDSGGAVSGTVTLHPMRFDVTGSANGRHAELRGRQPWGLTGTADMVVRTERSPTGRLTGTVELTTSQGLSRVYSLHAVVPTSTP